MVTTPNYPAIAKELRLHDREIAELAGTSHVTVNRIRKDSKDGICSNATRERVFAAIEQLKIQRLENLSRLSNGNCIPA
jgi:DNA-binding LacI/PurR family transcriptional regulator